MGRATKWAASAKQSMMVKMVELPDDGGKLLMKFSVVWDKGCPGTGRGLINPTGSELEDLLGTYQACSNTFIYDKRWSPKLSLEDGYGLILSRVTYKLNILTCKNSCFSQFINFLLFMYVAILFCTVYKFLHYDQIVQLNKIFYI